MTKKGMFFFILWIIFCIGLIVFMIVHTAVEQAKETNQNLLLVISNYFFNGGIK